MVEKKVLKFSQEVTSFYGSNYYKATLFFPKKISDAVFVYYAWIRIPDEYVDGEKDKSIARENLISWIDNWNIVVEGASSKDQIHNEMYKIFKEYETPLEYSKIFLQAMEQDLSKSRYKNYEELERYMMGSAVVVGFTMLSFFKLHKEDLLPYAKSLGEAMQLANFLRDVREDIDELGRVYLPQEDLVKFNVTNEDIISHKHTDNFKKLMAFEISLCRDLYKHAWIGIEKLPFKVKFPIRIATRNYEEVLKEIEKADYNIWEKRHSASKFKKFTIILKSIFT